jgi:hypothetical protein
MDTLNASGSQQLLPNLPGFKPYKLPAASKKSYFTTVNDMIFCKTDDNALPSLEGGGDPATTMSSSILSIGSTTARGVNRSGKMTSADLVNRKLSYQAYFEEGSGDPALEEVRVRKCNITFFLEDNSMLIVERPSMNSGIPQGTLVSRTQVPKEDGGFITAMDLRLGALLTIFGRQYRIVDCDLATRKYMRSHLQISESRALTTPKDAYEELRKQVQGGPSEEWGKYHSKKNANKDFMAASMGRFVDNSGREGFIKFGNDTIGFLCVWDNTYQLYGDKLEFALTYHLSDDTIEIFSIPEYNSGRDSTFTRLLKRSKLPKSMDNIVPTLSDPVKPDYVHWTDLSIGLTLEVYARKLIIIDADASTRQFYKDYASALGPSIKAPPPPIIKFEREIPPPTGYGSEADSLASCGGGAHRAAVEKPGPDKQLTFFASLLSGGVDDVDRRFVITYYLQDATIKVQEPPVRNSGFVGGLFLSRRKATGELIEPFDETFLYVGAQIKVLKHRFLILGTNDSTLKYMEGNDHQFTRSSFYSVIQKLQGYPAIAEAIDNGSLEATFNGVGSDGQVTMEGIQTVFQSYGIVDNLNKDLISEHECLTMVRKAGSNGSVAIDTIISEIKSPSNHFV